MAKCLSVTFLIAAVFMVFFVVCPSCWCTEDESKIITIEDMSSLWQLINDTPENCSVDQSVVDSGLKISYDLKKEGSWIDIYKDVNFAEIPEMDKLLYYYTGSGARNTIEFKLVYADGANFRYMRNNATVTDSWKQKEAFLHQFKYAWGGILHSVDETIDLRKVRQVHLAISNKPGDTLGKGYVIIGGIDGVVKSEAAWPAEWITAIINGFSYILAALVTGLIGYLFGRMSNNPEKGKARIKRK